MSAQPLLSIRDLAVQYRTQRGPVDAVRGVSFDVEAGSVTARPKASWTSALTQFTTPRLPT